MNGLPPQPIADPEPILDAEVEPCADPIVDRDAEGEACAPDPAPTLCAPGSPPSRSRDDLSAPARVLNPPRPIDRISPEQIELLALARSHDGALYSTALETVWGCRRKNKTGRIAVFGDADRDVANARAALSRSLRRLEDRGLIVRGRKRFHLTDLGRSFVGTPRPR